MIVIRKIFNFYLDGFRNMKLGKKLWILILIKLFIIFVVLKIFFFEYTISKFETKNEKAKYIREQLTK